MSVTAPKDLIYYYLLPPFRLFFESFVIIKYTTYIKQAQHNVAARGDVWMYWRRRSKGLQKNDHDHSHRIRREKLVCLLTTP